VFEKKNIKLYRDSEIIINNYKYKMLSVSILISIGVITTFLINYKLYVDCIRKKKYDDIPELNEIIKKKIEHNKVNKKKFKKILNDLEKKDFDEFIIIDNKIELENNE